MTKGPENQGIFVCSGNRGLKGGSHASAVGVPVFMPPLKTVSKSQININRLYET